MTPDPPEATGFFAMPRELRDKVHGYYFEGPHGEEDELDVAEEYEKQLFPCSDITLVCKHLRSETFKLY